MRMSIVCILTLSGMALMACLPVTPDPGNNNIKRDGSINLPDSGPTPDSGQNNNNTVWQPPTNSRVYVNTRTTLYYIDPMVSEDLVTVGDFQGTCTTGSGFYDIAVDDQQRLLGIAEEGLYQVNTDTAACSAVFQFPPSSPHFFSLSYVKGVDLEDPTGDRLIAASAEDGEWVWINWPEENVPDIFIHLGYYDYPTYKWRSSGDIVSIQTDWEDFVTYSTLKCSNYTDEGCESDWLAEISPHTGNAMLIGPTGYQKIFGLGFWGDKLYGFTGDGHYIHINAETGAGTLVDEHEGRAYWGAGNTTIPYVVK